MVLKSRNLRTLRLVTSILSSPPSGATARMTQCRTSCYGAFGAFLADHLNEIALGKEAAQPVFCNHIRCFFYHGLPLGPCSAWMQYQAHGVATP